jgi:hypothetical protein
MGPGRAALSLSGINSDYMRKVDLVAVRVEAIASPRVPDEVNDERGSVVAVHGILPSQK